MEDEKRLPNIACDHCHRPATLLNRASYPTRMAPESTACASVVRKPQLSCSGFGFVFAD